MNTLFKTVTSLHSLSPGIANDIAVDLDQADRIFIKDMVFEANIGVYKKEKGRAQKLTATIEVLVSTNGADYCDDNINGIMSYEDIVRAVDLVKSHGHIHLLEHFAEKVAVLCLENPKAAQVRITLNKINMFGFGEKAGVSIIRTKPIR